jgi:hypothetical protein
LYANVKNDRHVSRGSSSKLLRFFVNLPHLRRLEIQSYFIKVISPPILFLVHQSPLKL